MRAQAKDAFGKTGQVDATEEWYIHCGQEGQEVNMDELISLINHNIPAWMLVIAAVGIAALLLLSKRVAIKFDVNAWIVDRRESKSRNEHRKLVLRCRHAWTLYHSSPYSQCSMCNAFISTSILQFMHQVGDPDIHIIGEGYGLMVNPYKNSIIISDPISKS